MRRDRRILWIKPVSLLIADSLAVRLLCSARGSEASCRGKTQPCASVIVPSETLNPAGESTGVLEQHGGAHTTCNGIESSMKIHNCGFTDISIIVHLLKYIFLTPIGGYLLDHS